MMQKKASQSFLPLNRKLLDSSLIHAKFAAQDYEELSVYVLQVNSIFLRELPSFPSISEELGLSRDTKFLARYIFDLVVDSLESPQSVEPQTLCLACCLHAEQLTKTKDQSSYNLQTIINTSTPDLDQFLEQVRQIAKLSLGNSEHSSCLSPYQHATNFVESCSAKPQTKKLITAGVFSIIDLAITHPNLSDYSCQEISLASLKMVTAKSSLSIQKELFAEREQGFWGNIQQIKHFIESQLTRVLAQE